MVETATKQQDNLSSTFPSDTSNPDYAGQRTLEYELWLVSNFDLCLRITKNTLDRNSNQNDGSGTVNKKSLYSIFSDSQYQLDDELTTASPKGEDGNNNPSNFVKRLKEDVIPKLRVP